MKNIPSTAISLFRWAVLKPQLCGPLSMEHTKVVFTNLNRRRGYLFAVKGILFPIVLGGDVKKSP
jgi:hypothetical protein